MIGSLNGIITEIAQDHCIIEISSIGYIIYCSSYTLRQLKISEQYKMLIDMQVRESSIALFGFLEHEEKMCFHHLMSVQGVGAKMALLILGSISPFSIFMCVKNSNHIPLQSVSGIGQKLATRIITELNSNKSFKTFGLLFSDFEKANTEEKLLQNKEHYDSNAQEFAHNALFDQALSAMINLGFSKYTSIILVKRAIERSINPSLEEVIKLALSDKEDFKDNTGS